MGAQGRLSSGGISGKSVSHGVCLQKLDSEAGASGCSWLYQLVELFDRQASLFQKIRKGATFDRAMSRYSELRDFCGKVLLKSDVAPFLSNDHLAISL